jgi:hypothetical protein
MVTPAAISGSAADVGRAGCSGWVDSAVRGLAEAVMAVSLRLAQT